MTTDDIYIYQGNKTEGPYTLDRLYAMWQAQLISLDTLYLEGQDSTDWKPVRDFEPVFNQRAKAAFKRISDTHKEPTDMVAAMEKPLVLGQWQVGVILTTGGILVVLIMMAVSIAAPGREVVNLGLIADRLVGVIIGCTLFLSGVITLATHK